MTFQERAERGDVVGALRVAMVYGSLWAIGSSWSLAIRQIVVEIVPAGTSNKVFAELGAALITTGLGVFVALAAARNWNIPDCTSRCVDRCFKNDHERGATNGGGTSASGLAPAPKRLPAL